MGKRKIGIIIGAVCLLALVGGFTAIWQYETKVRGDIEGFLANLPPSIRISAEKIDVSFFKKSVAFSNIKGEYNITVTREGKEETIPMAFATDRLTAVGVNLDGFKEGAGAVKLLDSLTWEKASVDSAVARAAIASYTVTDISGDFSLLYTEIVKALPVLMAISDDLEETQRALAAMVGILKAYETFHIGRASIKDYTYSIDIDGEKVDTHIESIDFNDYSIRKTGPFTMRNMAVSYKGASMLQLEELALDEMLLPSFVGLFEQLAASPDPTPEMIQAVFKGQTFALRNMRMENMSMRDPFRDKKLFSDADMKISYLAETAHTADISLTNLNIDKALIAEQAGIPETIFASLPDSITFEGIFQTVTTPKGNEVYDLDCKKLFFKGTGLGEATLSFAANDINVMALFMGMPNSSALKYFDLTQTDKGFSDIAFAIESLESDTPPDQVRAGYLDFLRGQLENRTNQVDKDLLNGLVTFLEKSGGTLKIAVRPQSPSTVAQLMQAYTMDPEALGLTITATPAE